MILRRRRLIVMTAEVEIQSSLHDMWDTENLHSTQ